MTTLTVKTDKKKENPFYGKRNMLEMFQKVSKLGENPSERNVFEYLNRAFAEATDKPSKELFYVMLFAFGDVANREHNVFVRTYGKGKIQSGGESLRKVFIYGLKWMLQNDSQQFYKFLPIIGEYTNLENPFFYQLRTDRKSGKLLEVLSIVPTNETAKAEFVENITTFLANLINSTKTSAATHGLLAKWLKTPNFSKRTRKYTKKDGRIVTKKRELKEHTIAKERFEYEVASKLSEKLAWEIIKYPNNTRFVGLELYKAKHNRNSEAYLFSTKKVLEMDEAQFCEWLDKQPASARYRVQCRLFNKVGNSLESTKKWIGQYGDLANFYNVWLKQKETANTVVRQLEEKAATSSAGLTEKEKETLQKAKKDAKVNTGANSLLDVVADFFSGSRSESELNSIADNLLRMMKIEVPTLMIADISGSMSSNYVTHKNVRFRAMDMARVATTAFLLKNPDPELGQMLITFDDKANVIVPGNSAYTKGDNRFMSGKTITVDKLTDRTAPFMENYRNISKFVYDGGSTRLTSVSQAMRDWVHSGSADEVDGRKEMINRYPVFLVVSDGDINNASDATRSVQQFMMDMRQYFGWNGVLVIWDVKDASRSDERNKFEGIENVMYFGKTNPQVLNQIFSNIHDLDVVDVFEPLHSLYKSNRYQLVKDLV